MLPSPRLIIMVLAASPVFLGAVLYPPLALVGLGYLGLLVLYAGLDLLLLPRRRHIEIERDVPERVSIGVPTRVTFQVRNAGRRAARISLAEDLPENLEAEPPVCEAEVGPRARASLSYRLTAHRRGRYVVPAADVRVLPAFGLFYRQFRLQMPCEVRVFPNLANVREYELQLRRGSWYVPGEGRLRRSAQGTEFESLRRYVPGDPMTRVDWKATARRSKLIVRNYEPRRQQNIVVALDTGRATAGEFGGMSRLDYLINATLMLAYVALRRRDVFSFVAFSDDVHAYLPPVSQLPEVDRVARALYELQPRLVESDYAGACRFLGLKNRRRSLICLMTDVIGPEASGTVIDYLAHFAGYHLPLAVTLRNPELHRRADRPLAGEEDLYAKAVALDEVRAREEALEAMRHRGVGVLDVHPRAVLPELINRYLLIKSAGRL